MAHAEDLPRDGYGRDHATPRPWRTREDPFAGVWKSEIVPQLAADTDGRLQVLTLPHLLFEWVLSYNGSAGSMLRPTLDRRPVTRIPAGASRPAGARAAQGG